MQSEAGADFRSRIFEAAQAAFGDRGYGSVSVREIAAAAGVTVPMIYYYYDNKEGLFRSLIERGSEEMRALLDPIRQQQAPARQRLAAAIWCLFGFCRRDTGLVRLVHRLLAGGDRAAPAVAAEDIHRQAHMFVQEIIETGQRRGELRAGDSQEMSLMVFGVCGEFARRCIAGQVVLTEGLAERLAGWLLEGLREQ